MSDSDMAAERPADWYKRKGRLKVVDVPVEELRAYENNPRINDAAVPALKEDIARLGFNVPLTITKDNVIITGHTRLKAAMELGMDTVSCIYLDDLTEEEVRMFRLTDNKRAEESGWDMPKLDIELKTLDPLMDIEDFGFTLEDLSPITFDTRPAPPEDTVVPEGDTVYTDPVYGEGDGPMEDMEGWTVDEDGGLQGPTEDVGFEEPEGECHVQRGDIIRLGRHTVMCGDALDPVDMTMLVGIDRVDIAFTSPPYNAGHLGTGRAENGPKYLHDEDQRSEEEYDRFLQENVSILLDCAHEVFYNIGVLKGSKRAIVRLLNARLDNFKDLIYWKKNNPVPALAKNIISSATELIIAFGQTDSRSFRKDPGIWYGVIEGNWAGNNAYSKIHRATFPLYLPTEIVTRFTEEGGTVLDCFGGTGTTLIACEDTGRTCYMMEIEPIYVQTIVRRYIERVGSDSAVVHMRDGEVLDTDWVH